MTLRKPAALLPGSVPLPSSSMHTAFDRAGAFEAYSLSSIYPFEMGMVEVGGASPVGELRDDAGRGGRIRGFGGGGLGRVPGSGIVAGNGSGRLSIVRGVMNTPVVCLHTALGSSESDQSLERKSGIGFISQIG